MGRNATGVVIAALWAWALILAPTGLASAFAVDPNLVGHWKLDGNASDSADGHHGTLLGEPAWVNDPQRGWCLEFDGRDDYVDVGAAPDLTFRDSITVACWVKVHQFDRNWNAIVTKGDDWVLARTRDDNRVAFLCLGLTGGGWPEVYSGEVNDGKWHHVAGVYDGAQLRLYQDGTCVDSKTVVKGGGKTRRVADQNRGTPALCTPHNTGCQLFPIHFSDTSSSSGPGSSGSA